MRQIKTIFLLLMVAFVVTSCLKGNDSETTKYSDAAITSFSIGTLYQTMHTTSKSGADSTYKKAVSGSNYKFHIDQNNHRIYNTDSLPLGTDVSHVLVTLASKNNGTVLIQDEDDDTVLSFYSSADSIDFTNPRTFVVYSNDNTGANTEYEVKVNVHKEDPYTFVWQQLSSSDALKQLSDVEAFFYYGTLIVSGTIGETSKLYQVNLSDGTLTESLELNIQIPEGIKKIIGATSEELYALSDDHRLMVSRNLGTTWEEEPLDEDASMLPVRDISFVSYPLEYATNTEYALLVGNRSVEDYPQEKIAMVWRKIVDNDEYTPEGIWTYMDHAANNQYALPRLEHLSLVAYADGILAIGGANLGSDVVSAPYAQMYQSRDDGITWKTNKSYQFPEGFNSDANSVAMVVDDDSNLWMFCGGTGQVWRGRLNMLGWDILY